MLLDRHRLEVAASSGSLGLLADDVLVAIVHQQARRPLSERDRDALSRALVVLQAVTRLQGDEVVASPGLRTMAPLGALDEAAGTVNSALTGDLSSSLARYVDSIEALLQGQADDSAVLDLRALFERLANVTMARTEAMVHPPREQHDEWIKTASTS